MCCLEDGFKVAAMLARRGQRWLLRWREPPCGAKRRVGCLERCGFETLLCSLDAGSAGFYASASHPVWREATLCGARRRVLLPRAAASGPPLCSLDIGNAGFYAGASQPVARTAHVLPRAAALRSLPCSLDAGSAGLYAGARHPVARGGACTA